MAYKIKFKIHTVLIVIIIGALILACEVQKINALPEKPQTTPNDHSNTDIAQLIKNGQYEQALEECHNLSSSAEIEKRKIVYENYSHILESYKVNDLDRIFSFYSSFDNAEAASNLQPLFILVSYLDSAAKTVQASKILDKINAAAPDNLFYLNTAPLIFSKSGRYNEALEIIQKQLKSKPAPEDEKRMRTQLITVHLNGGKLDEALKTLEEEMIKYPQEEFYKNYLTIISQKSNAYEKTLPIIKRNLKNGSTDEASLKSLFYQSMRGDKFESALAEFERMENEKPDDIGLKTMVAELNLISGRHETASVLIEKLLSDMPENSRAHWLKGRLLFDTQNYQKAYEYFKKYVEEFKNETEPKTYYYLALSCIKNGNMVEALEHIKTELELSPAGNSKLLLREVEEAFFKEKMFNTAVNFFKELSGLYPSDSDLLSKISLFYYYDGDYQNALNYASQAIALNEGSFSTLYILGMVHSKLNDNQKALEFFKKCRAITPASLSNDAFNEAMRQSEALIWPFAHHYLCHIHAAMRCGDMKGASSGLNALFNFLADKTPPNFIVRHIRSIDPLASRPEYSLTESFKFFLENVMDESYFHNIEQKGEPLAITKAFIKDDKVRQLYKLSLKAQFSGDLNTSLKYTMDALKIEPDNIFLLLRAACDGIRLNSYVMMSVTPKIIAYKIPETLGADERNLIKCCLSSFKIGFKMSVKNKITPGPQGAPQTDDTEFKTSLQQDLTNLEEEVRELKKGKYHNMSLMMESTVYYFMGNLTKSQAPIIEYLKNDDDLSTFIWFITSFGGYFIF